MSDLEDDYLSDRFLAETAVSSLKSLTYAERRRQAQREAEIKNVHNRKKSRRELEEESRREGLSKSLFERAKEEEQTGAGQGSKAMAMMLKMGFKPGESLGSVNELVLKTDDPPDAPSEALGSATSTVVSGHLVDPLPLDVWSGRQGVGKRKRAVSPTVAGKLAKVVQHAEEERAHGSYRERARQGYEERRAEGQLVAATRTCVTLDEGAEKVFNLLWLNPQDPETFPSELLEVLTSDLGMIENSNAVQDPFLDLEDDMLDTLRSIKSKNRFAPEVVEEARVFIRMNAQQRLELLLAYLRDKYYYCFWCGTQYTSLGDLQQNCPGLKEEDHN